MGAEKTQALPEAESAEDRVPMFKDRNGKWCLFVNEEHERNTRESGEYEVRVFAPISAEGKPFEEPPEDLYREVS